MIAIYIDQEEDSKIRARVSYIIDFIFDSLGYSHRIIYSLSNLEQTDFLIWYDSKGVTKEQIAFMASRVPVILIRYYEALYITDTLYENNLKKKIRHIGFFKDRIPVISEKTRDEVENLISYVSMKGIGLCEIKFDLFGNFYYHLADVEAKTWLHRNNKKDEESGSFESVFKEYKSIPFINLYFSVLQWSMEDCAKHLNYPLFKKEYWPKGEDFAIIFSHTVDKLVRWTGDKVLESWVGAYKLLFSLRFADLYYNTRDSWRYIFKEKEQYWNFDKILKLDDDAGIRSTWFVHLLSGKEFDYDYLKDSDLEDDLQLIKKSGHEIAILLNKVEADKISKSQDYMKKLTGKNFFGLKFLRKKDRDASFLLEHKTDVLYDSSIVNNSIERFAKGNVLPYQLLVDDIRLFPLEIPVTFDDNILNTMKGKNYNLTTVNSKIRNLLGKIKERRGLINFNFNLSNYKEIRFFKKAYKHLIDNLKDCSYYNDTCENVALWWKNRSNVLITNDKMGATIDFPDDFPFFTIKLISNRKIKDISHNNYKIDGDIIKFINVKANNKIRITLEDYEKHTNSNDKS